MRFENYCIPFLFTSVPTFLESGLYISFIEIQYRDILAVQSSICGSIMMILFFFNESIHFIQK